MTYKVVRDHMASKMNVAYVEKDSAEENLKATRSHKSINTDMVDSNGNVKCMVTK